MFIRIRKIDDGEIVFGIASSKINLRSYEDAIQINENEYYDLIINDFKKQDIRIYDSWNPHIKNSPKRNEISEKQKSDLELKIEELENRIKDLELRIK